MQKRYYWIKLKTDFFTKPEIDFLMTQKNGAEYVVLYQILCLLTANTGGKLAAQMGEIIAPFDIDKIVREAKYFSRDTVTIALNLYAKLGLIYQDTGAALQITNYDEIVGSESTWAQKKREYREKKKCELLEDKTRTLSGTLSDKSIDIEKDIDKEKSTAKPRPVRHKYGEYLNVLLSDEEMEKLKTEFPNDYKTRIDKLSCYMASTGKHYKSHLATIRNWARRDGEKPAEQKQQNNNFVSGDLPFLK